jgi:hypothetical protein
MTVLVQVSSVETIEKLKASIAELFKKAQYEEITQAIGLHSILFDPMHMIRDQAGLYRDVLGLLKDRIGKSKGKSYGAWYAQFPKILDELAVSKQVVTDVRSIDVIASHRDAYGSFKSVDDFFVWALDDRKLPLDQIVRYIEKTAEMHKD